MNIQGSINQLLVLGAAGIKSDKQLQEYRGLGKRETQLRRSLDTLTKINAEKLDVQNVFEELSSVIGEQYKLSPSKENYKKTYDIEEEMLAFDDWYDNAGAGEKWDYSKWLEGEPERIAKAKEERKHPKPSADEQIEADKQRRMAKRRSAEEAAAKAQEDLINRQNERMRKDKSINFSSFIEGGIDG